MEGVPWYGSSSPGRYDRLGSHCIYKLTSMWETSLAGISSPHPDPTSRCRRMSARGTLHPDQPEPFLSRYNLYNSRPPSGAVASIRQPTRAICVAHYSLARPMHLSTYSRCHPSPPEANPFASVMPWGSFTYCGPTPCPGVLPILSLPRNASLATDQRWLRLQETLHQGHLQCPGAAAGTARHRHTR